MAPPDPSVLARGLMRGDRDACFPTQWPIWTGTSVLASAWDAAVRRIAKRTAMS